MSFILQTQRRAVEKFYSSLGNYPPIEVTKEPKILVESRIAYFLGTSVGVGTCSDVHGVDVLVVGEDPPLRKTSPTGKYSYAVLVRDVTAEERRKYEKESGQKNSPLECVELLNIARQDDGWIEFKKTGRVSVYVSVV